MSKDIGSLFSEIRSSLDSIAGEEEKLGKDEKQENRYIQDLAQVDSDQKANQSEIKAALSTFLDEVELADELAENLIRVEEDEIEIEKFFKNHEGGLKKEMIKQFKKSEVATEELVERFLQEVQTLDKEGENLERIIKANGTRSEKESFSEAKEKLDEVEQKVPKVEEGEESVMSRRRFIKTAAATGAGALGAKAFEGVNNPVEKALALEQKKAEELDRKNNQERTREEAAKSNSKVRKGNGKVVEEIDLGHQEVYAEIEVLRTSADSGLTIIEAVNESNQTVNVDISLAMEQLSISGLVMFETSSGFTAARNEQLKPGKRMISGAVFYNSGGSPGSIDYRIQCQKGQREQISEEITLDMPQGMLTDHAVRNEREIDELELDYRVVENGKNHEFEANLRNTTSSQIVANITFNLPVGWSHSGGRNIKQSTMGLVNTEHKLSKGYSGSMRVTLHQNDSSAPRIGTLTLSVMSAENPEEASFYLIPVDLK